MRPRDRLAIGSLNVGMPHCGAFFFAEHHGFKVRRQLPDYILFSSFAQKVP